MKCHLEIIHFFKDLKLPYQCLYCGYDPHTLLFSIFNFLQTQVSLIRLKPGLANLPMAKCGLKRKNLRAQKVF